jgi:hypothetical protein
MTSAFLCGSGSSIICVNNLSSIPGNLSFNLKRSAALGANSESFHLILFSGVTPYASSHHLKYHQSLQQIHLLEHLFQKYDHSFHQIFV